MKEFDNIKYCERRSKICERIKTVLFKAIAGKTTLSAHEKTDRVFSDIHWLFMQLRKVNEQELKARAKHRTTPA